MKRMTYLVMALAMVLGFTQCKKEQTPANNETEGVFITLDVNGGNNGSRVIVDPVNSLGTNSDNSQYATVTFEQGDVIYVGNNGAYVGYLVYDGTTNKFSGSIYDSNLSNADYLHFYFMGNKGPVGPAPSTVSITDQTEKYPVISYAHSKDLFDSDVHSYTAKLQNYCAIVKFTTNNIPTATAITVKGMQNTVSVDFAANNKATGVSGNPYTPGQSGEGDITLHAVSPAERWAILLEQNAVNGAIVTADGYLNSTCDVPGIANNTYHSTDYVSVSMTAKIIDLSTVTTDTTVEDGYTVTGTLGANVMISIADGATVTLRDATISGTNNTSYSWAGINCDGNTTLVLEGTNNVTGFYEDYPGIHIAEGKTLTIQGSGTLNASTNGGTNGWGAGIGGSDLVNCGNIVIESGIINATGGIWMAGIGGGFNMACGDITINGGTVTAQGGIGGAGIGAAFGNTAPASCGNITITDGNVTATGGKFAAGIGSGCGFGFDTSISTCGNITISGGTVIAIGGTNGIASDMPEPAYSSFTNPLVGGAGIGTGSSTDSGTRKGSSSCGTITIGSGVTSVTVTKGSGAVNSIGLNNSEYNSGTCGTVTIEDPSKVTQN